MEGVTRQLAAPCLGLLLALGVAAAAVLLADSQGIPALTLFDELNDLVGAPDIIDLWHKAMTGPSCENDDGPSLVRSLRAQQMVGVCSSDNVSRLDECAEWHSCLLAHNFLSDDIGVNEVAAEHLCRNNKLRRHYLGLRSWYLYSVGEVCGRYYWRRSTTDEWKLRSTPPAVSVHPAGRNVQGTELLDTRVDFGVMRPVPVIRQGQVRDEILWGWGAYRYLAWGSDELLPLSRIGLRGKASRDGGAARGRGVTLLGTLDTLLIVGGAPEHVQSCLNWVTGNITGDGLYGQVRVVKQYVCMCCANHDGFSVACDFEQMLDLDQDSEMPRVEISTQLLGGLLGADVLLTGASSDADSEIMKIAGTVADRLRHSFDDRSTCEF